jgi:hypothetical protein
MSEASSESVTTSIDWSAISANIKCPICSYNLRGLTVPRCPECGHRFDWGELFNPQGTRHRYLFEHHRRLSVWSFLKTLLAGLWPRRFWTILRPSQAIVARRLVIYWLVCSLFLLLVPAAVWLRAGLPLAKYNAGVRNRVWPGSITGITRQQFLNTYVPLPPNPEFFKQLSTRVRVDELWSSARREAGTILLWPWLTLLTLMIFQASMRRAKVPRLHVLRCVIYSADVSVWYALFVFLAACTNMVAIIASSGRIGGELAALVWLPILLLWVLRLGRLSSAYRRYMGFDHAFWTALSSQMIVALVTLMGLVWVGWIW